MEKEYYIIPIDRYVNGLQAYQIIEANDEEDAERVVRSYNPSPSYDMPSMDYICTGDFNKALAQLIVVDRYPLDLIYPIYLSQDHNRRMNSDYTLESIYEKIWM